MKKLKAWLASTMSVREGASRTGKSVSASSLILARACFLSGPESDPFRRMENIFQSCTHVIHLR